MEKKKETREKKEYIKWDFEVGGVVSGIKIVISLENSYFCFCLYFLFLREILSIIFALNIIGISLLSKVYLLFT